VTMPQDPIVVVGGGQAAVEVIAAVRHAGWEGPLVLIGEEPHLPYQRPPLSKGLLLGETLPDTLRLRPESFYASRSVELALGTAVASLDARERAVVTADGRSIRFQGLALTTGGRVRRLPVPGAALDGVCYLRTLDDALTLKEQLDGATEVVVVGGGFIGLEVAAVARKRGKAVTVIEAMGRLMARPAAPALAAFYLEAHRRRGVRVLLDAAVTGMVGEQSRVRGVRLADGTTIPADLVLVGIGLVANDDLARMAGLEPAAGIPVDALARTALPWLAAAGDCAVHTEPWSGGPARLESVQNAVDQGRTAGTTLTGGALPYRAVPWFWSDQFDLKLQMTGTWAGYDRVVTRGDPVSDAFSLCWFRAGRMIGVDSVNRPADHLPARRLLAAGVHVTPEQAADAGTPFKSLLPAG